MHDYMNTWVQEYMSTWVLKYMSNTCVCENMSAWIHECMSTWVHEYTSTWIHIHAWVHVYAYVHVHMHIAHKEQNDLKISAPAWKKVYAEVCTMKWLWHTQIRIHLRTRFSMHIPTGGVDRAEKLKGLLQNTESVFSVSSDFSRFQWLSLAIIRVSECITERKRTLCRA